MLPHNLYWRHSVKFRTGLEQSWNIFFEIESQVRRNSDERNMLNIETWIQENVTTNRDTQWWHLIKLKRGDVWTIVALTSQKPSFGTSQLLIILVQR